MRVVLDTSVIVSALRSPSGASAALLRLIDEGRGELLLSVALALEYEATCLRAEHRRATGLTASEIQSFVDGVIALAEPVEMHFRLRPRLRDPADEMVLETAVNGQGDVIATFNQRDFTVAAEEFGLEVLYPHELLRRMLV